MDALRITDHPTTRQQQVGADDRATTTPWRPVSSDQLLLHLHNSGQTFFYPVSQRFDFLTDHGRISSAAHIDVAEAAAVVLTSDNQAGHVYELAGDTSYTLTELAAEISRQSGRDIGYVNLPEVEFKNLLVKVGLPEVIAELLADSDTGASKGAFFDDSRQLSTLIGRPTTSLATAITAAL